ncbi:MAG: iron ABC transporter permease [Flavobacteriales bacterium]|nr:MAG: iron ABC transporter permease [Flavobacteriales bacterium]
MKTQVNLIHHRSWIFPTLLGLLFIISLHIGAVQTSIFAAFNGSSLQKSVLWDLRLPRSLGAMLIGAMLAVSGAALQGIFRNPLIDAGIIGVTTGASFSAVVVLSLSFLLPTAIQHVLGIYILPVFAFIGSLVVCLVIYNFSRRWGKTDVYLLILAGIALNAIFGALTGFIIYLSDDIAIRSFTFWSMGDLGGITWQKLMLIFPVAIFCIVFFLRQVKTLDALSLGDSSAFSMGVSPDRVNRSIIFVSALCVGVAVAFCGAIGFVGLVVPHIIRTWFGPSHRMVIPFSIWGGAILLLLADVFSRTLIQPAELPIGIITSVVGGPFFLYLLFKQKRQLL